MTPDRFRDTYPLILNWIRQTLATHAPQARPVAAFGFPRLPAYFSREVLVSAKVVVVEVVPFPPLTAMGLPEFADFENMDAGGITYLDTFFVKEGLADEEPLHFHELTHVIQWRLLGLERFLAAYADGLERFGYRDSPLEAMAYRLDSLFRQRRPPFDAESVVRQNLAELFPDAFRDDPSA
jgi:hypothetical protein